MASLVLRPVAALVGSPGVGPAEHRAAQSKGSGDTSPAQLLKSAGRVGSHSAALAQLYGSDLRSRRKLRTKQLRVEEMDL